MLNARDAWRFGLVSAISRASARGPLLTKSCWRQQLPLRQPDPADRVLGVTDRVLAVDSCMPIV
jgi:hypothetical protein